VRGDVLNEDFPALKAGVKDDPQIVAAHVDNPLFFPVFESVQAFNQPL